MKHLFDKLCYCPNASDLNQRMNELVASLARPAAMNDGSPEKIVLAILREPSFGCLVLGTERWSQFNALVTTAVANMDRQGQIPIEQMAFANAIYSAKVNDFL